MHQNFDPDTLEDILFNESPIPMALLDTAGRFMRLNNSFCGFVGYSRHELQSRTWRTITHPEDLEGDEAGAASVRDDPELRVYTITKRYITKAGAIVWAELHVRALWRDGQFVGYFSVAIPLDHNQSSGTVTAMKSDGSFMEWAKKNPKDAFIVGVSVTAFLGRDFVIELIRGFVGK